MCDLPLLPPPPPPVCWAPTSHLLGTHIPSPGHAKAAGIWLPRPHVTVPAQDTRHPARAVAGRFRHGSSPAAGKTGRALSKQPGVRAMFNPCPSPCCAAGHGDLGTRGLGDTGTAPPTSPLPPPSPKSCCGSGRGAGDTQRGPTGHQPCPSGGAPVPRRGWTPGLRWGGDGDPEGSSRCLPAPLRGTASVAGTMAAQPDGGEKPFHIISPTLESLPLSRAAGTKVYMKLENIQPTGSFKIRGIGRLCQEAAKKGCRRFVCSSGGNAGLAAAYAAKKLGLPVTVVVPSTTGPTTVRKLEELGAEVEVSGQVWDEANKRALELAQTEGWVSIHPFDHPSAGSCQPGPGAEGLAGNQTGRHPAGGGWRGAAGRRGGRPAPGGLAGRPHRRRRDPGGPQLPRGAGGRPPRLLARHHQRGQVSGSQDGGGAGAGVCPGMPGHLPGGGGRGGRASRGAVPG
ncbi:serine dehydratase-like isoform X2 [Aquila chrysaetos chrysaetos]|uniref:serine dehydratase-like isoform X2 n=1 Tax=Aquila chrysaetos chrysaetos TaxID=223781 RepID=UPI001B7D383A|nr:serine dehydratase-like isoform X2 [Aquila chrysaetos chrysaetos]